MEEEICDKCKKNVHSSQMNWLQINIESEEKDWLDEGLRVCKDCSEKIVNYIRKFKNDTSRKSIRRKK